MRECAFLVNNKKMTNTRIQTRLTQLEEVIDALQEPLFRFACFRIGSRADAEDVVQETLLRFASGREAVSNPKAYLFRAVANGCTDWLRNRHPFQPLSPQWPAEEALPPGETEAWAAEAARIARLLDRLPAEQAEVVRLHTFASLRFTEIAEVLDLPVSTVRSRFSYAIDKLKTAINLSKNPKS